MAQSTRWDYGFAEYDGSAIHRRIDSMDDVAATSAGFVPYNVFTFFETGNDVTPIASFAGDQLIPPAEGNQAVGQYVNFYVNGGTVSRIVLLSNQAALESDNHAYIQAPGEIPEPATMGLMGSALAGLAFFVRRSRISS